jgi:ribosomal protein L11 methyltransferase
MWRVSLDVPEAQAAIFEAGLANACASVARFERSPGLWRIDALTVGEPDRATLNLEVTLAAAALGIPPPVFSIVPLPERDWLAENRERFAAFRIGRFLVQEPDDPTPLPEGRLVLRIEAATAFGSGRHGSTEGCLRALQRLACRQVGRPVDIGCGSGILGIAAAKLWRVPVLATDCDPRAVAVTRANARLNGVGHLLRAVVADGWRGRGITNAAPFDLALCNILARPLRRMAKDLSRHLAPGGIAVLAGLLVRDGNAVLAAHRAAGLHLCQRIDVDGWRTLVLRRP